MSDRTGKDFLYDIQEAVRRIQFYTHGKSLLLNCLILQIADIL